MLKNLPKEIFKAYDIRGIVGKTLTTEVVEAIGSRATVIVDSGFRRGADVVKALALGANAVMIGRATLYGTAVAGEAGAARAIEIYRDEIDRLLALIGCPDISALDASFLVC